MDNAATRASVLQYAAEQYGTEPEILWLKFPEHAVLRRADSGKWYGIVMSVLREKLGLDGSGSIDVLNVKCGPVLTGSLRGRPGYLPAYHMSKASWISILLDDTVPLEDVKPLVDISYDMVKK